MAILKVKDADGNIYDIPAIRGEVGAQGANGKSAYEIAVEKGFEGTEEEWLASLKGATGKSAYQYAKEAGYSGTEAEFSTKMAEENPTKDEFDLLSSKVGVLGTSKVEQSDLKAEVENQLDGAKSDIVTELIAQIGGLPVFGTVDDDKKIKVTSTLADGVYSLLYKGTEGTYSELATFTIGNGDTVIPSYTNLNDPTITSGTIADWTITTSGWLKDVRYSASSNALKTASDLWVSCFVDIPENAKVLRVKGLNVNKVGTAIIYFANGAYRYQMAELATTNANLFTTFADDYFEITIETLLTYFKSSIGSTATFDQLRFTGTPNTTVADVIITLDEEIV